MSEQMTERQAAAWSEAIADLRAREIDAPEWLVDWTVKWHEETRPGRGQMLAAIWMDGDHWASIFMDVYGYPAIACGSMTVDHNSSDEECDCESCEHDRREENTNA